MKDNRAGKVSILELAFVALTISLLAFLFSFLFRARAFTIEPIKGDFSPPKAQIANMTPRGQNGAKKGQISPNSPIATAEYVREQAMKAGLNPNILLFILAHESQNGVNMRGDDGQSRGYFMISKVWHPEVSTACADDLKCSTAWTIKRILAGYINEWSTWRWRCQYYPKDNPPNCPQGN